MLKIYGHEVSGNSFKVKLLAALLQIEYEWIKIDLINGEQKSLEYLNRNSFAQVPTIEDGDLTLSDAQAILVYLARKYGGEAWLPTDALNLARVIRWLSITAGEVRQGVENARLFHLFGAGTKINIERAMLKSAFILNQLNQHLQDRTWLEFERPTIADVAVFPYVALARDGKIELDNYPHVLNWIERVKQLPNFVSMTGI
ncbi:MAG: glutathione S-transferase [Pseudanabaenaceae cyanobacterium bins.68]|nr:glutathione S-transferase [Pseudanabaenaceae cyanobacterium bins.68]